MKVKCRGWVSAFALLGIIATSMSGKSANAQQESGAFATAASFNLTTGIATDSTGNVYVANSHNTILKITPAGIVMTLAATPDMRGHADGIGSAASFVYPIGIATDSAANVYVVDKISNTVRKITPAGVVTTLAGTAGITGHADGIGGNASFSGPVGVATDNAGNVYVADYGNDTIRKIAPNGAVTTLAGTAGTAGNADGIGANASFSTPYGMATDSAGNVLVLESDNIREVNPSGVVTTIAGPVFGPWHFQDQFCEWDVPPDDSGAARSGTRKCTLNPGTTYCSSSIEVTSANPGNTMPKLSLIRDGAHNVSEVDTKFKLERADDKGVAVKGDPKPGGSGAYSWLHYVVKLTVSSTSSCK